MQTIAHILLTHTSHTTQGYTYLVPDELIPDLCVGMLVEVDFASGEYLGVVADIALTEIIPEGLKLIRRILTPALLSPGQIHAILRYAEKHILQVHQVLGLYLPTPLIRRILKYGLEPTAESIAAPNTPSESLVYATSPESLREYVLEALETPGTAVIAPSDPAIHSLLSDLKTPSEGLGILTSNMTDIKRSQFWMDTFSWKYPTCIWTRRLALYNLSRYSRIIYLEESLIPEILGHFHAYAVRELLWASVKRSTTQLEFVSLTPSVDLAARAMAHEIPIINLPNASSLETPPKSPS